MARHPRAIRTFEGPTPMQRLLSLGSAALVVALFKLCVSTFG